MQRQGRLNVYYRLAIALFRPAVRLFTRRQSTGAELIPDGGVILAVNHISHVDPIVLADFVLDDLRRVPRFMAKSTLFTRRSIVGAVMRGADQIPVQRGAADASLALSAAVQALQQGETIVIYPEGTVSRDPDKWPMLARTGVARLALLSGVPVVPVAQWGAQAVHDTYRANGVHLLPRHTLHFRVGPPVDLSPWRDQVMGVEVLRNATRAIMDAITAELEQVRGESAPTDRHDPRAGRRNARSDVGSEALQTGSHGRAHDSAHDRMSA